MEAHFSIIMTMKGKFENDPQKFTSVQYTGLVEEKCFLEQHGKFLSADIYLCLQVHCLKID